MEPELGSDGFPLCSVCKGEKKDHGEGKSIHAYTTQGGFLATHAQAQKQNQQPQVLRVPMPQAPLHPTQVDRLVETLLDKGVLTREDALYIAGYTKEKPAPAAPAQFMDPAQLMLPGVG